MIKESPQVIALFFFLTDMKARVQRSLAFLSEPLGFTFEVFIVFWIRLFLIDQNKTLINSLVSKRQSFNNGSWGVLKHVNMVVNFM